MTIAEATRWEERVMRGAHPIAYRALELVRRPAQRVPGLGVLVRDATLLREVLLNTAAFSKTGPGAPSDLWTPVLGPTVLLNMEGEEHAALRRKLAPLFSPRYVERLAQASLGGLAASITARLRAGERVDVVAESRRSAGVMISQLVGLGEVIGRSADLDDDLLARVSSITGYVRLSRPRLTPPQVESARAIVAELTSHARRAYRDGDESTVPGRMRSLELTEDEAMGAVAAFVLTGTETIVAYLPRLIALLADSGWLSVIASDRGLVEPAITEGLRVTTPSPVMLRSVVTAAQIGGVAVRPGDRVILATYAANRALGRFDPEANVGAVLRQLWFGAGTHFCLGAPLAMAQIRLLLGAVLDAAPVGVVSRRIAKRQLIPGYASLVLERGAA
jgi:cytochrome P450